METTQNPIQNRATTIQQIEAAMIMAASDEPSVYKLAEMPLKHTFTPGLYSRKILMRQGMLITSETHKTEHQFVLLKGIVSVWTEEDGAVILYEGHHGITKPGTRRVLYIHEEAEWITFHSTLLQTPEEIEDDILEKCENPLLQGHYRNNVFYPDTKQSLKFADCPFLMVDAD